MVVALRNPPPMDKEPKRSPFVDGLPIQAELVEIGNVFRRKLELPAKSGRD